MFSADFQSAPSQVCTKLRSIFGPVDIPIVMCTALTGSTKLEQCREAGASDVLPKPYERSAMIDMVEKHCGEKVRTPAAACTCTRLPAYGCPIHAHGWMRHACMGRFDHHVALQCVLELVFAWQRKLRETMDGTCLRRPSGLSLCHWLAMGRSSSVWQTEANAICAVPASRSN